MLITESDRLLIREFHIDDADALMGVFGDAEVMRFGRGVQTAEWVRAWLQDYREKHYARRGYGLWAVALQGDETVIGYCGLTYYSDIAGRKEVEIGYRLARPFWGRGYATEAASAVRDYTFGTLALTRLIALIDPGNTRSIRVAEKLQMLYEKDVMFEGDTHPDRMYAITAPLKP